MKKVVILLLVFSLPVFAAAQTDSTCAVVLKLYNTLKSGDKVERNKYKMTPGEIKQGEIGKYTVYKSSLTIPGFVDPQFIEGGTKMRYFTTHADADTYEGAVKLYDDFNAKMHNGFTGSWTFTENNEPEELYKNSKISSGGSLLLPTIRYHLERAEGKFRLVLEIYY